MKKLKKINNKLKNNINYFYYRQINSLDLINL